MKVKLKQPRDYLFAEPASMLLVNDTNKYQNSVVPESLAARNCIPNTRLSHRQVATIEPLESPSPNILPTTDAPRYCP